MHSFVQEFHLDNETTVSIPFSLEAPKITVVGSINIDTYLNVPQLPHSGKTVSTSTSSTYPGGKGVNQTIGAAKLGHRVTLMNISAGSSKAMFPVYLKNLEKISPDSIYFLEYKIDSLRTPDCNPKKRHVLLRIHKENYYASTQTATYYNNTSSTVIIPNPDGYSEVRRPTNSNRVFPISENSVCFVLSLATL